MVVRLALGDNPRCVSPFASIAETSVSYSIFFATFDITRRTGLRVKRAVSAQLGADVQVGDAPQRTLKRARIAQAGTIVGGGIIAASLAEAAGRPFRAFQRLSQQAARERDRLKAEGQVVPERYKSPIRTAWRAHGLRAFYHRDAIEIHARPTGVVNVFAGAAQRAAWRVAAVGPWGLGFLVFAWLGGEV